MWKKSWQSWHIVTQKYSVRFLGTNGAVIVFPVENFRHIDRITYTEYEEDTVSSERGLKA
jgi:hypothetical protein